MHDLNQCLIQAFDQSSIQDVQLALEMGADPNYMTPKGTTPLDLACEHSRAEELISLLFQHGALFRHPERTSDHLEQCIASSNWQGACVLSLHPAVSLKEHHLTQTDRYDTSLSDAAAALGQCHLLKKIAQVHAPALTRINRTGIDPFWHASASMSHDCLEFLAPYVDPFFVYPHHHESRLHVACFMGALAVVRELSKSKVSLHVLNDKKEGLLHYAAKSGSLELVQWLVENEVSYSSHDLDGYLPLDIAFHLHHQPVYDYLLSLSSFDQLRSSCHPTSTDDRDSSRRRL